MKKIRQAFDGEARHSKDAQTKQRRSNSSDEHDPNKMHPGFTSYRRKSKHLIDVESGDDNQQSYIPLDDLNSPSPRHTSGKSSKKDKFSSTSERVKKFSNYSYSDISVISGRSKAKNKTNNKNKNSANTKELQFHHEDEVKEYIVQPESYKLTNKDPFGLDILSHVDQLWLEHTVHSMGSLPGFYYQYNVFDDSEQRILFLRPNFDYVEDYRNGPDQPPTIPTSFRVFTAIGMDICRFNFKTNYCCTKTQMLVEVNRRGRAIGYIKLISNSFNVVDPQGRQVMRMEIVGCRGKSKFRCCFSTKNNKQTRKRLDFSDSEIKCNVYTFDGYEENAQKKPVSAPYGTISQNGEYPETVVRGEPFGYYFLIENDKYVQHSPAKNLYKLFVLATLLTLTIHYNTTIKLNSKTSNDVNYFSMGGPEIGEEPEHLDPQINAEPPILI